MSLYRQQNHADEMTEGKCPKCGSTILVTQSGRVSCGDCGHDIGPTFSKWGAKKTRVNGKHHDSKFEASADEWLETRKAAGDIKDFDRQYQVVIPIYKKNGVVASYVRHKIDYRLHLNDGSYELLETKGLEGDDWKWRKRLLLEVWIPEHLDHTYKVLKQEIKRGKKRS